MNVLQQALGAISTLIKLEKIKIIKSEVETVDGFPKSVLSQSEVMAHVQQIEGQELQGLTDATIGSQRYYEFWVLNNNGSKNANVISYLESSSAYIEYKGYQLKLYGKIDWTNNASGWISFKGTANATI